MRIGCRSAQHGFTLIELMIVVAIIGLLSSVAISNFKRFQMKSKSSEAKVNLAAIRTAEEAYFSEYGVYVETLAEPATIPGLSSTGFDDSAMGYATLGWIPEGNVYFSYGVGITADGTGFSADAGADIDGDTVNQYWVYARTDTAGNRAIAKVGCDVSTVTLGSVNPCTPQSGQSVF
jgi:type IV pilus assembly protein PilA